MSFITNVENLFSSLFGAATRFFGSLFQAEANIVENLHQIVVKFDETKANIAAEVEKLKSFEFNPHWKSRVINVPAAIDQIRTLAETVVDAFKGKFEVLIAPIHDLSLIFKQEQVPSGTDQPSALAKTAVKIDEISTMIAQLATAMEAVANMTEVFKTVTDQIESLDALFLSQGNAQKKQLLTIRKRIRSGNGS